MWGLALEGYGGVLLAGLILGGILKLADIGVRGRWLLVGLFAPLAFCISPVLAPWVAFKLPGYRQLPRGRRLLLMGALIIDSIRLFPAAWGGLAVIVRLAQGHMARVTIADRAEWIKPLEKRYHRLLAV